MSGVAVVTDTTQYLPDEVIERHGLKLVSLYVNWDGRTDRESDSAPAPSVVLKTSWMSPFLIASTT